MKKIRIHVFISGRVQGVGYRYSTAHQANMLGIFGWVKNTYDNRVEAVFEGDEKSVKNMLVWCKQGPGMAKVMDIEIHKQPYSGEFSNFSIKG